jgi:hypothetical protein
MIYTANELLLKLKHLTLAGQNEDGELEWVGEKKDWDKIVMIYTANELLLKLKHLILAGQNEDGELEWVGEKKDWDKTNE